MAAKNKSNEILITRVYDAPVKTVWEAWTDLKQVAQWWGPRGFTLTTHSKDLRAGGHWDYTMHGPDGVDYPNLAKYLEFDEYKRLVYDHGGTHDKPALFRVTALFTELKGGKTRLELSFRLPTPEAAEEMEKFIRKANGYSTWDRLAEFLEKNKTGKEKFFINRSFDCDLATMFEMWTSPEHFSKWLAPTGMEMKFLKADIRTGGATSYFMSGNGMKMYGSAKYMEVTKPNRLVYTQVFNDEKGNISRHPMAPTWPETMLTTVTLTEEGPTRTRVSVEWEVYGNCTPEELETFIKARSGMMQGWTGSFDKLESYIEKV